MLHYLHFIPHVRAIIGFLSILLFLPMSGPGSLVTSVNASAKNHSPTNIVIAPSSTTAIGNPLSDHLAAKSSSALLAPLTVSIDDASVTEGNSGFAVATFHISLSEPNPGPGSVSVQFDTANSTATVADNDYQAQSVGVTFLAGAAGPATINVPVNGDQTPEADETFYANLSGAIGMTIVDGQGIGTITDDDKVTVSIDNASVTEGNSGFAVATFHISLSEPNPGPGSVFVQFDTANSTATVADSDYQAQSVGITFLSGAAGPATINVPVYGDQTPEADETFYANLSGAIGMTILDGQGIGTITDDDKVTVSIDDASVTEGNSGFAVATFHVSLSEPNPGPGSVTVQFTTADSTATVADNDYQAQSVGITFLSGAAGPATINVPVNGDTNPEADETFFANLSGAIGMTILDAQGIGTIFDDEAGGVLVSPTSGLTTTEGGGTASFEVVLDSAPSADVTIPLSSSNTAEGTVDAASLTFTSTNWNVARTVTITGVDDAIDDGDIAYTIVTGVTSSADLTFDGINPSDVAVTNLDNDSSGVNITPTTLTMAEGSPAQSYQIALSSVPVSGSVTIQISFDPGQLAVNGGSVSPLSFVFSDTTPQFISVAALENSGDDTDRTTLIHHSISASTAPEYAAGTGLADVTVHIGDVPPPPPSPTCEQENFDEHGVVRTGIPDALRAAINCRILYQNSQSTTWLGGALYSEANLGVAGLLDLGVLQAIDIFSPSGMNYFNGGAVFCLRGEGTLIWLAASGQPRHAEIIGSYPVPEFPGFTCATLFEPGTLILVAKNPAS